MPDEHTAHEPGRCHTCWFPCRAKVDPGTEMCPQCELLLSQHPSVRVRAALARYPETSEATLRYLMSDGDFNVVLAATEALAARDGAHLFDSGPARPAAAATTGSGKETATARTGPDGWSE